MVAEEEHAYGRSGGPSSLLPPADNRHCWLVPLAGDNGGQPRFCLRLVLWEKMQWGRLTGDGTQKATGHWQDRPIEDAPSGQATCSTICTDNREA